MSGPSTMAHHQALHERIRALELGVKDAHEEMLRHEDTAARANARVKEFEGGPIPCDRCESLVLALEARAEKAETDAETWNRIAMGWRIAAEEAEAALTTLARQVLADHRVGTVGYDTTMDMARAAGRESGSTRPPPSTTASSEGATESGDQLRKRAKTTDAAGPSPAAAKSAARHHDARNPNRVGPKGGLVPAVEGGEPDVSPPEAEDQERGA